MIFSIVIPVYNVEKYLEKCINSVLKQEFNELEIILVDDGSTDSSGIICDKWSEEYDFIKTIHKENGGLDSARKKGLEFCEGEYIIFLDSDDWLRDNCLKGIWEKIKKIDLDVDVIQTVYTVVYPNGVTRDVNEFEKIFEGKLKISGEQFAVNNFNRKVSMNNVWSKIYRKKFLENAKLPVLPKYSCEDVETLCDCVIRGVRYSYIENKMVMFRSARPGSITTGLNYNYVMGYFETMVRVSKKIAESGISEKDKLIGCCADMFVEECQYIENFDNVKKKQLYRYVEKNRDILKFVTEKGWKHKIYRYCGIQFGNQISCLEKSIYNIIRRRS